MSLRSRVSDLEDQLEALSRRLARADLQDAIRQQDLDSLESQFKELRDALWPLFRRGKDADFDLEQFLVDVQAHLDAA